MTALPPPVPPPPGPSADEILGRWDRGASSFVRFIGELFYWAVVALTAILWIGTVCYVSAGEGSIALSFAFWAVIGSVVVQRLARRRRRH